MFPDDMPRSRCCVFGPFRVDLRKRQLWHHGQPVHLNHKTFEVLAVLIEHRDEVLDKDTFMRLVWPDTVVLESNLVRQISMLRRALGQRPDQHDIIVTIPGSGYQFVADVTEVASANGSDATSPSGEHIRSADVHDDPPNTPSSGRPSTMEDEPSIPLGVPPNGPEASSAPSLAEPGRNRTAVRLLLVGLAAGGVVALGAWVLGARTPAPPDAVRDLRKLTFEAGVPREPAWSPDGARLAYTSDRAGNADIWIQSLGEPDPIRLTDSPARDTQPGWSPDGSQVAFRSDRDGGGIYVVAAAGGAARRVADHGSRPQWSPDGRLLLIAEHSVRTGARGLTVVDAEGESPRPILVALIDEFTRASPGASIHGSWHPDGRVSIWGRHPETGWTLITTPLSGAPAVRSPIDPEVARRIAEASVTLGRFVWARSGRALFFEGVSEQTRNGWRVDVTPHSLAWSGGPERLTTSTSQEADLALSPDGTRLAFTSRSNRTRLWALPLDADGVVKGAGAPVTADGGDALDADALADGSQIAYRSDRGTRQELRVRRLADGQDRLLLASDTLWRSSPRWSPDGTRLAYAVSRVQAGAQRTQIAVGVYAADAGAERQHETAAETTFVPTGWSGDGRIVIGWCRERGARTIGTCLFSVAGDDPQSGRLRLVASDPSYNLFCQRFSPDGRWISFIAVRPEDPGAIRAYAQPSSGGAWVAVSGDGAYVDKARWNADGRAIYYISDRGGALNVWGQRFDPARGRIVGAPFRVTSFAGENRAIPAAFGPIEMAITTRQLFVPIKESSAEIWILDHVDR